MSERVARAIFAIGLFLVWVSSARAAIALDSVSTGQLCDSPAPSGPLTIAHTTADVPDGLMVALVGWRSGSGLTTVTVDGVALTEIRDDNGDSGFANGCIWAITNPPVGTFDVVVTTSDGVCRSVVIATFTGVDQLESLPTNVGDVTDGSPVDVAITTVYENSWIVAAGSTQNHRTMTELSGYTEMGDVTGTPDEIGAYGERRGPVAAGAWTPGWTHGSGGIDNTISAVEVKEKISLDGQKMRTRCRKK